MNQAVNVFKNYTKTIIKPTNLDVKVILDKYEMCVCDIANVLSMTKSAVSHQLAALRRSGIVKCRKNGKEVYYTLDDDHIVKLFEMADAHLSHGRRKLK